MKKENNNLKRIEKIILRVAAFFAALFSIIGVLLTIYKNNPAGIEVSRRLAKAILAFLNLIPLIIYFKFSKRSSELKFKENGTSRRKYRELMRVGTVDEAERKTRRVNILVRQLHENITWYAVFLVIVYVLYIIESMFADEGHRYVHFYLNIPIGVFNYLSALFLLFAFKVLYDKTIDDDDETELPYRENWLLLSVCILLIYATCSFIFITDSRSNPANLPSAVLQQIKQKVDGDNAIATPNKDKGTVANDSANENANENAQGTVKVAKENRAASADRINENYESYLNLSLLFIGSFNGLAMALLFGRYVSMEQSAYNMKWDLYEEGTGKEIIHACTIYLLPIYALAQPLFGSFEIYAFGDPLTFANWVFFICFVGKVFFLYLTYVFMKRKLMHLYLHSVVTSHGVPKELANCFERSS